MANKSRIIIPCRAAYLNCWRPTTQYGGDPRYSLTAIIPKEDEETLKMINDAIEHTRDHSLDKWGGRLPGKLNYPLKDGDESENSIYHNAYYMNMKSKDQPQIVDRNVKAITDQTEVYSGCYIRVSCTIYAYSFGPAKGLACWLGNIQKIRDAPALGGRKTASEEFRPLPEEDFLQ